MTSQYRHRRTSNPSTSFPGTLEPGEIAVNTANRQLALGDADGATIGAPLPLLTIRFFDARAQYATNDYVINNGIVYRANAAVPPGAFNASNWTVMANPGTFVLRAGDTMLGHLSLPTAPAAANAVRKDYVDAADSNLDSIKVDIAGETMTGLLTLSGPPTANLHAATKAYVDAKPVLTVSDTPPANPQDNLMWWDSDTGTLYVRYNDGVGTPQWVQAVAMPAIDTSAFVLKAGSTMTGDLTLKGNPTAPLHAVPKQYLETAVPRYQRISLAGVRQVDVQVPAGATMARISGMSTTVNSATAGFSLIQLSVAPGVFKNAVGDYQLNGTSHQTVSGVWSVVSANSDLAGMLITQTYDTDTVTAFWDGQLQVKRKHTAAFFCGEFSGTAFESPNGYWHTLYQNLLLDGGSALGVLAFRLSTTHTSDWAAESYLNVEWL